MIQKVSRFLETFYRLNKELLQMDHQRIRLKINTSWLKFAIRLVLQSKLKICF